MSSGWVELRYRKVDENAFDDETGCWVLRFGVCADHGSRDRLRTTGCEPDHQFDVHLSAGNGGAECTIARHGQPDIVQPDGDRVAATTRRIATGGASADGSASARRAGGSAIHWANLPSCWYLQQLLTTVAGSDEESTFSIGGIPATSFRPDMTLLRYASH